jgi:Family of unknown function (DUF6262)
MVRNLAGLKHSAQSRSDGAMSRATLAIRQMKSEEVEINFRSVAARAGVSTAWLYRTKPLRDKIMKARTTSPAVAVEAPQYRQRLSHERIVATLRLRVKTLEDGNRELREQLEAVYGRLAVAQFEPRSSQNTSMEDKT